MGIGFPLGSTIGQSDVRAPVGATEFLQHRWCPRLRPDLTEASHAHSASEVGALPVLGSLMWAWRAAWIRANQAIAHQRAAVRQQRPYLLGIRTKQVGEGC